MSFNSYWRNLAMDLTCYNSYYEVNLSVLEENFKKISRFIARSSRF